MKPGLIRLNVIRWALLLAAPVLIVVGVLSGEMQDVYRKAAQVCLECIGIG